MPAASVAAIVQRQLDAYNARDLDAFVACYADDVEVFRLPALAPALAGRAALAAFYGSERFDRPGLHAELLSRVVMGRKVIDHERIAGLGDVPREVVAVYAIDVDGLIATAWFFDPS